METGQNAAVPSAPSPARRYDKGERRHKHSGRTATASVDMGNPKRVVGKCPNNIDAMRRGQLLQTGIPARPTEHDLGYDKHLYLTHQGTIYECATSDLGMTYHAYPYHGFMLRSLIEALRLRLDAQSHPAEFDDWVRDHIKVRG